MGGCGAQIPRGFPGFYTLELDLQFEEGFMYGTFDIRDTVFAKKNSLAQKGHFGSLLFF